METVTDQLTEQFGIGNQGAHTFAGLGARVEAKLTAHTLGLALNWQMGKAAWLQIKALAFPISHMTRMVFLIPLRLRGSISQSCKRRADCVCIIWRSVAD